MQLKTILNRIQKHRGFVYGDVRLADEKGTAGFRLILPPLRIAMNRRRRRRQEGVEPLPYNGVALASCSFEAETIDDLNPPPTIANEAGSLHRLRCKRH